MDNIQIVQRLRDEVWNRGNLDTARELLSDRLINHDPARPDVKNREDFIRYVQEIRTSFSGFETTALDVIAEGDKVVVRWMTRGTQVKQYMGLRPSEKQGSVSGITIYQLEGGKIAEIWWATDLLPMFRMAGVLPEMEHA